MGPGRKQLDVAQILYFNDQVGAGGPDACQYPTFGQLRGAESGLIVEHLGRAAAQLRLAGAAPTRPAAVLQSHAIAQSGVENALALLRNETLPGSGDDLSHHKS
jgi:glutathione S-transferase